MRRPSTAAVASAVLLAGAVAVPLALVIDQSLRPGLAGGPVTMDNYRRLADQPLYATVLVRTFVWGGATAGCCVVAGTVFGIYVWLLGGRSSSRVLTACAAIPLGLSLVVVTFAWFELLRYRSLLSRAAGLTHLLPATLLGTRFAAVVGIVYLCLPINALAAILGLRQVRHDLMLAARSMGASTSVALRTIALPVAAPSLATGALLSFVVAIGAYLVPEVLGGPHSTFVTYLIVSASTQSFDPGLAAALATVVFVACLPSVLLTGLMVRR